MSTPVTTALDNLRPLREGLLQLNPPRLLGSRCTHCRTVSFPSREFCPACSSGTAPIPTALSPAGTVYSHTTVFQAPAGRKTPYTLAYVDLDDGVRVLAQVDSPAGQIAIGDRVRLALRPVTGDDGESLVGYVFLPQDLDKEQKQ